MKLLRFIHNVWNSIWDAIFDGDMKDLLKSMVGYAGGAIVLGFIIYIFGLFGEWVGVMKFMPPEQKSTLSIGVFVLGSILIGLLFLFSLWAVGCKLIEIWKKS